MKELEELIAAREAAVATAINAINIGFDDEAIAAIDIAFDALHAVYTYKTGEIK